MILFTLDGMFGREKYRKEGGGGRIFQKIVELNVVG